MGHAGVGYPGNQPLDAGSDGSINNNVLTVTGLLGIPITGTPQQGQTVVYNPITGNLEWGWPTMSNILNTGVLNINDQILAFLVQGVGLTRAIISGTITTGSLQVADNTGNLLALFDDKGRPVNNPIGLGIVKLDASGLNEIDFVASPDFTGSVTVTAISSPVASSIPLAPTETVGG